MTAVSCLAHRSTPGADVAVKALCTLRQSSYRDTLANGHGLMFYQ